MTYREIKKELLKKIRKDYGKKCKEFEWGCVVCQGYFLMDFLEDAIDTEENFQ